MIVKSQLLKNTIIFIDKIIVIRIFLDEIFIVHYVIYKYFMCKCIRILKIYVEAEHH